ncbi:hypothetical protein FISHEDRAFT_23285, partial [Fistulina hepatica ATCC 64428]
RGAYIWGRSVHNVRIERLWADVTIQVGASWAETFTMLELHYGLNINDHAHVWLLHHLFLPAINAALDDFHIAWNNHRIQIRDSPNRSPEDMYGFDMFVHGFRGDTFISDEELEVYGVDWDALRDPSIL